jgi:protein-S-isoprenylcysteine O-methyltransferase Ste14
MVVMQRSEARPRARVGVVLAVGYAVISYLTFLAVFGYGVAFLADAWVPRTVDHGGPSAGAAVAAAVDSLLLAVFAVQHSVMARPAFKKWWTRVVPPHLERSTYVLATSAALSLAFWQWRPIPAVVWDFPGEWARVPVWALYAAGWLWALAMTFAIDHLDMLGLRQVARHGRGLGDQPSGFRLPLPYQLVRHPMMTGLLVAFLATPTMTVGHLLFAGLGYGYILVGVRLEERDLADDLPEYAAHAAATPRFLPRTR